MDKSSRLLSWLALMLGLLVTVFLSRTSRGIPMRDEAPPSKDSLPPSRLHDLNQVTAPPAESEVGPRLRDSLEAAVREHLAQLEKSRAAVDVEELQTVAHVSDAHRALEILRPYWLHPILDARLRVGGQFLGPLDSLHAVSVASVDGMRLEFSPTEPHWIVQVFLR
jgi:hypothetical protein